MSREEDTSLHARVLGANLDWPSPNDEQQAENGAGGVGRAEGDDLSPARGYFLGTPPGRDTEELATAGAAPQPPGDLDRVLRDGALRFESLVGSCQAELQDTVAAHVSDLEQTITTGTEELNRVTAQRIGDLEEAIDARLVELQRAAVNDRIARLGARLTSVGRLAIVAVVVSILALGVAVAALVVGIS